MGGGDGGGETERHMSKFVEGNMKHGDSSKIGRGGEGGEGEGRGGEIRAGSIPPRGKMSSSGILGQQQGNSGNGRKSGRR